MDHLSKKWTLNSLTIGPQLHKTNTQFWEEALNGLPPLPRVEKVTIVHNYTAKTDCWRCFDRILSRRDLFPALKSVRIRPSIGRVHFSLERWRDVNSFFSGIRSRGLMICELLAFGLKL